MKKLILALLLTYGFSSELTNYLDNNYNELFDMELQKSIKESDYNSLSWISPIMLSFERSWDNTIEGTSNPQNRYTISINQPIFKSGGIYYGIKSARSSYNLAQINILKQKNELIAKAIEILFQIKQSRLTLKKLDLQVKNAIIEIKQNQELLDAGLSDTVSLDNAIAKKESALIAKLEMQSNIEELKAAFAKISNKNPDKLKLPTLKLVSKDRFLNSNLDIDAANAEVINNKNLQALTRSKYLPTVSVGASYTKFSPKPFGMRKDSVTNYSLSVSMPLSVNMNNDLEIAKLNSIISSIKAKQTKKDAKVDYNLVLKKISIINRKIALAKKEASAYKRLLKATKNLYKAGQRSKSDVELFRNSYKIKKLDAQIYSVAKQIELLKLYKKMR